MDDKLTTYYIGDIAKALGLSQRAIRYYEELGFVHPSRTEGGFRRYSDRDVETLRMVLRFKDLGMSLEEIGTLFSLVSGEADGDSLRQLRAALLSKRREFEARVDRYREGIDQLNHVLHILSVCATCGRSCDCQVCEACLRERRDEASPFLESLLSPGTLEEKQR